jgi:predicted Zn-dependent peptidase
MQTKYDKLKNGGVLIYEKSKVNNCSAVEVGFFAGAFNEKKPGTAHMLEHNLFKKTKNRTNNQVEDDRNKIAFLNASTSMDYLVIKFFRTNKLIEPALDFSYDILMNSLVDDEFFENEKGVISEELNMCLDNESRDIFVKNLKQTILLARSSSDIVGKTQDNIQSIKFKDLENFKKKYFVGNNFVVSVVSSLSFWKIKKLVNKKFVKQIPFDPKLKEQKHYYDVDIVNKPSSIKIFKTEQEKVSVMLSIKIDVNELDVFMKNYNYVFLTKYLSGVQGDLFLKLRNKGLIYRLSSDISSFKTNSLFNIIFETSKEKIKDIFDIISDEVNKIVTTLIDEDKINSYKDNLEYLEDEKLPAKLSVKAHLNLLDILCFGKIFKLTKKQKKSIVNEITPLNVNKAAKEIFNKKNDIFVTVLGNASKKNVPDLEYFKSKFLLVGDGKNE